MRPAPEEHGDSGPGTQVAPRERHEASPSTVVSIITVNYKVAEHVSALIASVPDATQGLGWEVIVVDNDSRDGSVELLRERHPDVTVLASGENLGFSRGNNLGAARAHGSYLALVNPDVVLTPNSLVRLVGFLQDNPRAGLVGPRVQLPSGLTQSSARSLPGFWDVFRALPGMSRANEVVRRLAGDSRPPAGAVRCGIVHGSCMVFPADVYREVGGLPEHLFMYGEEPIIGHRVRQAGYEVWYEPSIFVMHEDEACADKRWVPHQKALRKRNGHIAAHAEVLPRSLSIAWNALMAARELSRSAKLSFVDRSSARHHFDFARLHWSGMSRTPGDAKNSLPD
jgi:N-acetylglucosaminyl-diphospho-decaprenol L-rhamnosyltransferase